jgi:serine phosphatase RsbU (regulator of sigma subunit)
MTGAQGAGRVIEWGAAGAGLEAESGDVHAVVEVEGGVLVAVIDGLGHGVEAAVAAKEAARVLATFPGDPLVSLFQRCHEALHQTRGAVMSVAAFEARGRMTWAGVGNVEAFLLHASRDARPAREAVPLRGGIVGFQLPTLRPSVVRVSPGDTLVMATDGLRSSFAEHLRLEDGPQRNAEAILARDSRGTDDALVVVARYVGEAP